MDSTFSKAYRQNTPNVITQRRPRLFTGRRIRTNNVRPRTTRISNENDRFKTTTAVVDVSETYH